MKIRTERIECYWAKGSGKDRDYRFYIDFPRVATKAEEAIRKEFVKHIKGRKDTEGRGYNWRVSVETLRAVAVFLPDPKAIKAEMERFDREGVKPPDEPYHVKSLGVMDTDVPSMISLSFDEVPEKFRRACDYWRVNHRVSKDERYRIDLFGGRSMCITQSMLLVFESWLFFDKPWQELYDIAFAQRKIWDDEIKARQYAQDAPFRAKYHDWDQWTSKAQHEERWRAQEEWLQRIREAFQQNERFHRTYSFSSTSKVTEALKLFELPKSATLQDVKKRYRALSKVHHPDVGGSEEAFKKLNAANQALMQHLDR